MQTTSERETLPESPKNPKNKPFFCCELVKNARFVYKAGYNYTKNPKTAVNLFISRSDTQADLFLFYELRASWIKFDRLQVGKLVIYQIKAISTHYLDQISYELTK